MALGRKLQILQLFFKKLEILIQVLIKPTQQPVFIVLAKANLSHLVCTKVTSATHIPHEVLCACKEKLVLVAFITVCLVRSLAVNGHASDQ